MRGRQASWDAGILTARSSRRPELATASGKCSKPNFSTNFRENFHENFRDRRVRSFVKAVCLCLPRWRQKLGEVGNSADHQPVVEIYAPRMPPTPRSRKFSQKFFEKNRFWASLGRSGTSGKSRATRRQNSSLLRRLATTKTSKKRFGKKLFFDKAN